jgi:hypothetical protein
MAVVGWWVMRTRHERDRREPASDFIV